MDSLVANYASSDEEEEEEQQQEIPKTSSLASSLFSSLPLPNSSSSSSSLFSSLPQLKQQIHLHNNNSNNIKDQKEEEEESTSTLFSSLPRPKTQTQQQQPISNLSPVDPIPKRVVQFKPPVNPFAARPSNFEDGDEEGDDEGEKERKRRKESEFASQSSSVKSFLSSIPAPKNSFALGVLPSAAGSGRRSIVETEAPVASSGSFGAENESVSDQNSGNYGNYELGFDQSGNNYMNYGGFVSYESGIDRNGGGGGDGSSYGTYESYGNCGNYGQFGNDWTDGSVAETAGLGESGMSVSGKRGRKEMPTEIVEVKQDELMKNRPREDQVKLTGIAFGPAYQPASTKGKPSKLQKRKHQIGSLFYDMKQKETELAERRAKGFLTKAQTQGKYGW